VLSGPLVLLVLAYGVLLPLLEASSFVKVAHALNDLLKLLDASAFKSQVSLHRC
jgi:hypothetical protein